MYPNLEIDPFTGARYKKKGGFFSLTCEQFYKRVLMLARGLHKAGMKLAIVSRDCTTEGGEWEWHNCPAEKIILEN